MEEAYCENDEITSTHIKCLLVTKWPDASVFISTINVNNINVNNIMAMQS